MLILRKNKNHFYKPLKQYEPRQYDIESLLPLPIPSSRNQRILTFVEWHNMFFNNIENMIQYIFDSLSQMRHSGYIFFINKDKLRESLVKYIYNVSSNSYKNKIKKH